jgi:CDP-glucose 4,6-dehydratase
LPDTGFWSGRRVLVTGHTGFKGAWLSLWLSHLGARVTGLSRGVPTEPSLYALARLDELVDHVKGDVRDPEAVAATVARVRPEVVLHLAAQPFVRRSFREPVETYATNVMGTVHVLDAVRRFPDTVAAVVVVSSDKCYQNRDGVWGYREDEPMGGHDPYSSSKGATELVTAAYRASYFADHGPPIASARAGNVFGGGDWGEDRLLPDIFRAALASAPIAIRNPDAIRPWQHVLNPLSGYLMLAQTIVADRSAARSWNFGPADTDARPVRWIIDELSRQWDAPLRWEIDPGPHPHEAHWLKLDSSLARSRLGWAPCWGLSEGLERTVEWYQALRNGVDLRGTSIDQIEAFTVGR